MDRRAPPCSSLPSPSYPIEYQTQVPIGCQLIYHVVNRGNGRMPSFHKDDDDYAFTRIVVESWHRYPVELRWPSPCVARAVLERSPTTSDDPFRTLQYRPEA